MLDEHPDGRGGDPDKHDGEAVEPAVDVLPAATEGAPEGFHDEFLGCLEHSDADSEAFEMLGKSEEVGCDAAGTRHGDADAAVAQFVADGAGENADVCLGGGVHGDAGHGRPAGHTGHVEDVALGSVGDPSVGHQPCQLGKGADVERAVDADALRRHIGEGLEIEDSGVVDEQGGPEVVHMDKVHEGLGRIVCGEVDAAGMCVDAVTLGDPGGTSGQLLGTVAHHHQADTSVGQRAAEAESDAGVGAGDEGKHPFAVLSVEFHLF